MPGDHQPASHRCPDIRELGSSPGSAIPDIRKLRGHGETKMREILKSYELGPYKGLIVEAENETAFVNELMNKVIDASTFDFDDKAIEQELPRIESDLRTNLEADNKPFAAFCYVEGIEEDEFPDFCRREFMRSTAENTVIQGIADAEGLQVTDADISDYKTEYREQYAKTLLDDPDLDDKDLVLAIMTKKVLGFLMRSNTWRRSS